MLYRPRTVSSGHRCHRRHQRAGGVLQSLSLRRRQWLWDACAVIPVLQHTSSSRSAASCSRGTASGSSSRPRCCGCGMSTSSQGPSALSWACRCRAAVLPSAATGCRCSLPRCQALQGCGRTSPCGCSRSWSLRPAVQSTAGR